MSREQDRYTPEVVDAGNGPYVHMAIDPKGGWLRRIDCIEQAASSTQAGEGEVLARACEHAATFAPFGVNADKLTKAAAVIRRLASSTTPASGCVEEVARYLLAAEYERDGSTRMADELRATSSAEFGDREIGRAIRAIGAALATRAPDADEAMVERALAARYDDGSVRDWFVWADFADHDRDSIIRAIIEAALTAAQEGAQGERGAE